METLCRQYSWHLGVFLGGLLGERWKENERVKSGKAFKSIKSIDFHWESIKLDQFSLIMIKESLHNKAQNIAWASNGLKTLPK